MAATTLFDIARVNTGTIGTGTITLGSAVQSFLTFAGAGVADQTIVRYLIEDPPNREVGFGTYTASGTTLTRNVVLSTNSNSPISLSGVAQVALTALAEDITNKNGDTLQGALNWATAPTVSSAATTTIGAQTSNYIIISGTTTITAFDSIAQSAMRWLRFSGALTLTHNATSLICIGGASITTAAGDIAQMISEGSGNWRMLAYTKASGAGASITPTVTISTASATITIPPGATKCKVTIVGGGGGGGGALGVAPGCPCTGTGQTATGGLGGAGGVVVKYLSSLTSGNTLSLTIGAGGSAGSTGPGAGGAGGNSSLSSGSQSITTLTASGGGGGAANNTGGVGAVGSAGTGTNGDLNFTGAASGATGLALGLPGGPAAANSAGNAGLNYGGPGSGGFSPVSGAGKAGGAGVAGAAIFEWYA